MSAAHTNRFAKYSPTTSELAYNRLSSGRRETGLKVQILFAPHFSLQILGDARELIEIGARARDSRSRADPETALVAANRQNRAKPVRARFC